MTPSPTLLAPDSHLFGFNSSRRQQGMAQDTNSISFACVITARHRASLPSASCAIGHFPVHGAPTRAKDQSLHVGDCLVQNPFGTRLHVTVLPTTSYRAFIQPVARHPRTPWVPLRSKISLTTVLDKLATRRLIDLKPAAEVSVYRRWNTRDT